VGAYSESGEEMTHALSAILRHVRPIRSLCEGGVTLVMSPGESEPRWNVGSASCFMQTRAGGERVPCYPDLEDCGEKDFYSSEIPTAATCRQTHDRPAIVQGAPSTGEADRFQNMTRNSAT